MASNRKVTHQLEPKKSRDLVSGLARFRGSRIQSPHLSVLLSAALPSVHHVSPPEGTGGHGELQAVLHELIFLMEKLLFPNSAHRSAAVDAQRKDVSCFH